MGVEDRAAPVQRGASALSLATVVEVVAAESLLSLLHEPAVRATTNARAAAVAWTGRERSTEVS